VARDERLRQRTERDGNGGIEMSDLKAKEYKRFEDIKVTRADGSEYWPARELAPVLGYAK
jgi:DNA-damage-inducible protein D